MSEGRTYHFKRLSDSITKIGFDWHANTILENSKWNKAYITKSIRDLNLPTGKKGESAIVISAGPSLYKNDILPRIRATGYEGTIVAVDGSYIRCLKAGIFPDYVMTLDPHPTRLVRWFGDPEFHKNLEGDDYFSRQDLDIAFRTNSEIDNLKNINLVNQHGKDVKLLICSASPKNVLRRALDVGFDMYWWAPLVDDPALEGSLTRQMAKETGLPAMNTGGTVGTAAWVFALKILKIQRVAVVGMDLGYYKADTPYTKTQTYYSLIEKVGEENIDQYFPEFIYPPTGECFYTDPTYDWYRNNMLDLIEASGATVFNCTGGGTLAGPGIECIEIEDFCNLVK